jgi:hypothetical protein
MEIIRNTNETPFEIQIFTEFIETFLKTILEKNHCNTGIDWNNKESVGELILNLREILENTEGVKVELKRDLDRAPGHRKNSWDILQTLEISIKIIPEFIGNIMPKIEQRYTELGGDLNKLGNDEEDTDEEGETE